MNVNKDDVIFEISPRKYVCTNTHTSIFFSLNKLAHTFYYWCLLVQGFTCPVLDERVSGVEEGAQGRELPEELRDAN